MTRIAVLGAGAWGTALAAMAVQAGNDVRLWARSPEIAETLNAVGGNPRYLPDVSLPPGLRAGSELPWALENAEIVLLATPAQHVRVTLSAALPALPGTAVLVICAKGIEKETLRPMTEVVAEIAPENPVAILSGPTFAREAALGLPTLAVVACRDAAKAEWICRVMATPAFRPYVSDDTVAVCLAGAVKNVLAIACGIVAGRALGDNAKAALITRGLAEMRRLIVALGGRAETVDGLSGLGDLVLTAGSLQSRNMSLGYELGKGRGLAEILGDRVSVTEGVWTAAALVEVAARHGVDMPICEAVDGVINRGRALDDAIRDLLSRPIRRE